jgi:hypothetical protein
MVRIDIYNQKSNSLLKDIHQLNGKHYRSQDKKLPIRYLINLKTLQTKPILKISTKLIMYRKTVLFLAIIQLAVNYLQKENTLFQL